MIGTVHTPRKWLPQLKIVIVEYTGPHEYLGRVCLTDDEVFRAKARSWYARGAL